MLVSWLSWMFGRLGRLESWDMCRVPSRVKIPCRTSWRVKRRKNARARFLCCCWCCQRAPVYTSRPTSKERRVRATQTLARREYKTGRLLGETDRGSRVSFVPPRRPVSNIYKTELVPLKKKGNKRSSAEPSEHNTNTRTGIGKEGGREGCNGICLFLFLLSRRYLLDDLGSFWAAKLPLSTYFYHCPEPWRMLLLL